jgi:hypothetical protein
MQVGKKEFTMEESIIGGFVMLLMITTQTSEGFTNLS